MRARRPVLACILALGAVAGVIFAPAGRAEPEECAVPAEMTAATVRLARLAARIQAHEPVTIVAIGGASTKGAAAGSAELAYPSRLQQALAEWYPEVPIKVVNKGVPRQSAEQMFDRFPSDVIAEDPVLVVWETGIVDAVRGVEIDDFAGAVQRGIDELKNRAVDIVLMDMQFSRSTATVIDFERYLRTLHRMGELNDVYVFPRYAMMRYWSEQNVFNFDSVAADDRAKLAAKVYNCIGSRLAAFIRHAVQ
jgi:hypothetical protein